MNEVAKLTYKEQVLSALKEHTTTDPASALTVREAIEKSGLQFNPSSHSAAIGSIWRKFGVEEGTIKFFDRIKKGKWFAYYKATPMVDEYTVGIFKHLRPYEPLDDAVPVPFNMSKDVNIEVSLNIDINIGGLRNLFK